MKKMSLYEVEFDIGAKPPKKVKGFDQGQANRMNRHVRAWNAEEAEALAVERQGLSDKGKPFAVLSVTVLKECSLSETAQELARRDIDAARSPAQAKKDRKTLRVAGAERREG